MPSINNLLNKMLLNFHIIAFIMVAFFFILNMVFYSKNNDLDYYNLLLDKTYENVNEIYIDNEFGKSIILSTPKRSRIIVKKCDNDVNQSYIIKIDVLP